MDLWTTTALLFFCVTVAYSYRSVLRPVLPQMSAARKGILAVTSPFIVVYGLLIVPIAPLSRTLKSYAGHCPASPNNPLGDYASVNFGSFLGGDCGNYASTVFPKGDVARHISL